MLIVYPYKATIRIPPNKLHLKTNFAIADSILENFTNKVYQYF